MQDNVVLILLQVHCSSKMMFSPRLLLLLLSIYCPRFNVLNLIYMIIHSAELFSFSFFSKVRNQMIFYMLTMFHQCLVSKSLKLKNVPTAALSDMKGNKNVKRSRKSGAIALLYPPRVRFRATVKLSAVFFHDESSITIGGYESAIAPEEFHIQCKQPVEAAEDEINLVVEEETHKDKGLLFVPSISGLCLFFCHHFLYSVVPS